MNDLETPNVIKIDPKGKYVFVFDGTNDREEYEQIAKVVGNWWKDETNPFLFIWGCKLEKIETEEK